MEARPEETWTPSSWRGHEAAQQPAWPDLGALASAEAELATLPPLVFAGEVRALQSSLAEVSQGRAFLLQAGDCAESFADFSADSIRDKLKVILQMAVTLLYASGVPVVKVGRIAGQFAKPRSSDTETIDGVTLPSFRGHMANGEGFDAASRRPEPERLLQAYRQSVATLNLLRAFTKGGFADLSQIHAWNQEFVASTDQGKQFESVAAEIDRAMRFMSVAGIDLDAEPALHQVDFYTSHEALILPYEEALTRRDSLTGAWVDCSAHMVWIGERTRQIDGAHVEFFRGISNPIGVKVGPTTTPAQITALCDALNPEAIPGRLSLITRLGAGKLPDLLGPLVEAVAAEGQPVVWVCDPMHANTFTANSGLKTRRFEDVLAETSEFFALHRQLGTWPGGVHLELTGDDVTECLGGLDEILDVDLASHYTSVCDPRLNARQALDLAFGIADLLRA